MVEPYVAALSHTNVFRAEYSSHTVSGSDVFGRHTVVVALESDVGHSVGTDNRDFLLFCGIHGEEAIVFQKNRAFSCRPQVQLSEFLAVELVKRNIGIRTLFFKFTEKHSYCVELYRSVGDILFRDEVAFVCLHKVGVRAAAVEVTARFKSYSASLFNRFGVMMI